MEILNHGKKYKCIKSQDQMINGIARFYPLLIVVLMGLLGSCKPSSQVEEYTENIFTYPFSDTCPFPVSGAMNVYPYSRIDGYSHDGEPRKWRMVKLENKYVEVYILPEIGGKVWGAIDKTTEKEFIYMNDVVKFRDVAMRGPWTSGGIEWNSGLIGHHPGGAAPVNYRTYIDDDGTAHCIVGGMDLPSHMQWRVDISLPGNSSYFESRTFWYNATPFHQSYYSWANAAIKASEDLQFYYPGNHRMGHDGIIKPWPVDEQGVDRSLYRNYSGLRNGNFSVHVVGSADNYNVSFYHDEDFGSGHWSPIYSVPGKKIWIWSLARSGAIWEDLLTDTHGQYVEVQVGRMYNQNNMSSSRTPFKQACFIPFNADAWEERWFPVSGTGGVTRVAEPGTVHISYDQEGMLLRFSPMIKMRSNLSILVKGQEVLNEQLDLDPNNTLIRNIANVRKGDELKVWLGKYLLYSTEKEYTLKRPFKSPGDALDDRFILAGQQENFRMYGKALDSYMEVLKEDSMRLDAAVRIAELYLRRGEPDKACCFARKALSNDAYLPEANFIYGTVQRVKGNYEDAREAYGWSVRSPEFRSASLLQLAEISLMDGKTGLAYQEAERSLTFNPMNLNAYRVQAIAKRLAGEGEEAGRILDRLLEMDPLDHFALFEKYLLRKPRNGLKDFNNSFQNEMSKEEYLELALYYQALGLQLESAMVLEEAPADPVVLIWLAWLNRKDQKTSAGYLKHALASSPEYVFPYRTETLEVLLWASKQQSSWVTDYYSALILWHLSRNDEAMVMLEKWGNEPDFSPFYYTRAQLRGINTNNALSDLERALNLDPEEWRLYRDLANIMIGRGEHENALAHSKAAYERFPDNYILNLIYSKALTMYGKHQRSLDVLERVKVLPYEGENSAQRVFMYNHLMLAWELYKEGDYEKALSHLERSEAYPENLGSGMPEFPDYRDQDYLRKLIFDRTGNAEKSMEASESIRRYSERFGEKPVGEIFRAGLTESRVRPF